jgi:hypothetical protein
MSTIKLFARKSCTIAALLWLLCAISVGASSPSDASEPQELIGVWSKAVNPAASYTAPALKVHVTQNVRAIGYGYPDSDTIVWTKTGGLPKGDYRVPTAPQPCGSTRSWVGVTRLLDSSLQVSHVFTQTRECAASYGSHVNDTCGPDQDKLFMVRASVPEGKKISWGGTFRLALTSGYLYSPVWHPAGLPNIVEYYFPAQPNQHVDTAHPARSSGFITKSSGAALQVRVTRICQGYGS